MKAELISPSDPTGSHGDASYHEHSSRTPSISDDNAAMPYCNSNTTGPHSNPDSYPSGPATISDRNK